ncbi:hypothetical protein BDQ17DRAFT_1385581 [Cyathus striatus]|nr:hypothetical protein BDQ17DRAFT_1385581 [Cyathus striatus]
MKEGQIAEYETFWRIHQTWLKTAGYIMRPRYWVPSWLTHVLNKWCFTAEDYITPLMASLLDAFREQDGVRVMLKKCRHYLR